MTSLDEIIDTCRVPASTRVRLKDYDPSWAGDKDMPKAERKAIAEKHLTEDLAELTAAQELLYAADTWSVLLVFQAMDAAGKDGTIKHVMSGVNPQGCQVSSFKQPSAEELDHDFLWRCVKCLPERGRIGIFNRSYYEEVLIVKVHPELLAAERIPGREGGEKVLEGPVRGHQPLRAAPDAQRHGGRSSSSSTFRRRSSASGSWSASTSRRSTGSSRRPTSPSAAFWDDYLAAYEDTLSATSTEWAPWYVIPADHKWVTRALVAKILVRTVQSLDLKYPEVTPNMLREIEEARRRWRRRRTSATSRALLRSPHVCREVLPVLSRAWPIRAETFRLCQAGPRFCRVAWVQEPGDGGAEVAVAG